MGFIGTSVNGLVVTRNFNFDPQSRPYANAITADGQLIIGSTVFPNLRAGLLGSSDGSITWTVGAGTITGQVTGGTSVLKTLTPDSGGAQLPTAGNINILGSGSITTVGSGSTITTQLTGLTNHSVLVGAGTSTITKLAVGTNGQVLIGATGANPAFAAITSTGGTVVFTLGANTLNMEVAGGGYSPANIVVDPIAGKGNYQTITAALAAAVSGDNIFIREGTYTENITLKAGVNLFAINSGLTPTVTILGTVTASYSGTASITGTALNTNSAAALAFTGANATILYVTDCFINGTNSDAITANAASAILFFENSYATIATTFKLFSVTSISSIEFRGSRLDGPTTTASTIANGSITFDNLFTSMPVSTSGTSTVFYQNSIIQMSGNTTALTTAGTATNNAISNCIITTGTATASSIGSGTTLTLTNSTITSSNANALTGAGTLRYGGLVFTSTSTFNVTTQVNLTPVVRSVVRQVFSSGGTYTPTTGMLYADVEIVGAGGGSGGVATTASTTLSFSGGGGAGEYARGIFSAATIGANQTVTIGAAGAAGAAGANTGGTGGTTSLGALITAIGGTGGSGGSAVGGSQTLGGAGGTGGSGGTVRAAGVPGGAGLGGFNTGVFSFVIGGQGGASYYGGGGRAMTGAGAAGTTVGSGAGGSANSISTSQQAGAAGAAGQIVITEYVS